MGKLEYTINADGVLTNLYDNAVEVVIPEGVKVIGFNCLRAKKHIKKVIIPEGVQTIEDAAFMRCYSLETVELPTSLTRIGRLAFAKCPKLTTINLEHITHLGSCAFEDCESLMEMNLWSLKTAGIETVQTTGWYKLNYYKPNTMLVAGSVLLDAKLLSAGTTALIPSCVSYVAPRAFSECDAATVAFQNAHTELDEEAFLESRVENITLPEQLDAIPYKCFWGSKTNTILLPETLKTIGAEAFGYCDNLVEIEIPSEVTHIGAMAFHFCRALKSVEFQPRDKKKKLHIGCAAFCECPNLRSIKLPANAGYMPYTRGSYMIFDDDIDLL